jgi:hypothetical protein
MVHVRDGPSTVCRIIIKSDKECPRDASARTIRDTRTRIRGRNLIPSAAIKADTGPVDVQRERELERERERGGWREGRNGRRRERERERDRAKRFCLPRCHTMSCDLGGKNYGPALREERSQIVEIIPRHSSPLSLSLSLSRSLRPAAPAVICDLVCPRDVCARTARFREESQPGNYARAAARNSAARIYSRENFGATSTRPIKGTCRALVLPVLVALALVRRRFLFPLSRARR